MLCVFDGGSYTLTDVVGFTNLNQSSLSRAIVRMEKKGLVTRSRRSHDARLMSIEITQAGRTLCERASQMVREACDEELAVLTKAERDIFVRIAQKLLAELPPPKRPAGLSY
jgi:DNA-binding MarR family transcriptional regulator